MLATALLVLPAGAPTGTGVPVCAAQHNAVVRVHDSTGQGFNELQAFGKAFRKAPWPDPSALLGEIQLIAICHKRILLRLRAKNRGRDGDLLEVQGQQARFRRRGVVGIKQQFPHCSGASAERS